MRLPERRRFVNLTPQAQRYEHRSCKHIVGWSNKPEIIIINSAGHIAIRREATPLECQVVSPLGGLCFAHESAS